MSELASLPDVSLYLDSNVFVYAFEGGTGPLRDSASLIVRRVFMGESAGCTSVLSRAEVLVHPLGKRQVELADRYRRLLTAAGPIDVRPVEPRIADLAAELRADYSSLKLPDAIHIATAIQADCGAFITADKRLAAVSARIPVLILDQITDT